MKKIIIISVAVLVLIVFSYFYSIHKTVAPNSLQTVETSTTILDGISSRIIVTPSIVMQGEPAMIQVDGMSTSTSVQEILFAGKSVKYFLYKTKPTVFVAIDLNNKIGEYSLEAKLNNGTILKNTLTVVARPKSQVPLGIPAKLGGNSTTSQNNLVNTLVKENALIKALETAAKVLWNQGFQYPIQNPIITDPFGYSRLTGIYTISHLGVDFRAHEGTPVMAMNQGIVKFARSTIVYGNMIVIDHGLGLETLYAHLSKINVVENQTVEKGQVIGLSGQTGYAEQPHLHVSVKINKISVDPIKFLEFFK